MPCLFHPQKHLFFRQSFIVATCYIEDVSISSQTCVASALNTSRTITASTIILCARPIAIGTPAGKVLVKRSRTIEHGTLLSLLGIKVERRNACEFSLTAIPSEMKGNSLDTMFDILVVHDAYCDLQSLYHCSHSSPIGLG